MKNYYVALLAALGAGLLTMVLLAPKAPAQTVFGVPNIFQGAEAAAPASGVANQDLLWADSTAHAWKMNNNNGGVLFLPGLSAALTANIIPKATGTNANLTAGSLTDNGLGVTVVEGTAPSGVASSDLFYADSTAHRWKMNNNNGGAVTVMSQSDAVAAGQLTTQSSVGGFYRSTWGAQGGAGPTTATTVYFAATGVSANGTTEANFQIPAAVAITLKNLACNDTTAPGTSNTDAFTVRSGGAATSITCSISGASTTTCSDATHTAAISAGGLVDIQDVTTGTPAARQVSCSIEVDI